MNILLLGGTGAIGNHLVSILSCTQNQIYITSRGKHEDNENIHYILGNAHEMKFIQQLLAERFYEVIIDFMYYSSKEFSIRVDSFLAHGGQYICISSSRVYANSKNLLTEKSPRLLDVISDEDYQNGNDYSIEKCRLENILTSSKHGNWTIIRPYITYSENRLQLGIYELKDWYYRVLHGRTIQLSSRIANSYTTLTYGLDVAKGIASIIGQKKAWGEVYHITQDNPITWKQVLQIYVEEIERATTLKPKFLITKKDIFSSIALRDMQVEYDRSFNRFFNNSKILSFCDTTNFIYPDIGLRHCLRSFLANPVIASPDWWKQALMDRLTGDTASEEEFQSKDAYHAYLTVRNARFLSIRNRYTLLKKRIKYIIRKSINN